MILTHPKYQNQKVKTAYHQKNQHISDEIFLGLSFLIDLLNSFAQKSTLLIVSTLES